MLDTGGHGCKSRLIRELVAQKTVTNYRETFFRRTHKRLKKMDICGHHWSPFQPVFDEQIDVAGPDTPLVAELRSRQFTGVDPAPHRLLRDAAVQGNLLDGEEGLAQFRQRFIDRHGRTPRRMELAKKDEPGPRQLIARSRTGGPIGGRGR
jgi:hypothetical protein